LRTGKGIKTSTTRNWGSGYHLWSTTGGQGRSCIMQPATMDSCVWTTSVLGYENFTGA